jgi:hypothetical protein
MKNIGILSQTQIALEIKKLFGKEWHMPTTRGIHSV